MRERPLLKKHLPNKRPPKRQRSKDCFKTGKNLCASLTYLSSECKEKTKRENSGGGRFSERSASPGPPPEERRAFELCVSVELVPPERWVRFPASRLRSRRLTEPPRLMQRGAYPQSCAKAHDSSFCGRAKGAASVDTGFRLCGGEAVDGARLSAFRSPLPPLRAPAYRLVSEINVGRSRRLCQPPRP